MEKRWIFALTLALAITGCAGTFERNTFKTLATAQATLNTAQAAYEVSATAPCPPSGTVACLPHSAAVYNAVTKAKEVDVTADQAMVTYEQAKIAGANSTGLAAAQADVTAILGNLNPLISDIEALYTGAK